MKEVITKLKFTCVSALTRQVLVALDNARLQIEAQATKFSGTQLPPLREESQAIAERFMNNLNRYFDDLTTHHFKEQEIEEYGNLSLVDHDYLEAIIAMEGMVNHARNCDIQQYISFTTRLAALFPNLHVDETNNPLDPEQIGDSFNEAIRPLGLKAHYLLTIYREFNKAVFHNLEDVLAAANDVMIDMGILPKMDIKARNKELQKTKRATVRPTTDRETRAFTEDAESQKARSDKQNAEMFAMMQTLVENLASKQSAAHELPVAATLTAPTSAENTQQEIKKQQTELLSMLSNIQATLEEQKPAAAEPGSGNQVASVKESINESLHASNKAGTIGPLDRRSADVINLVTLLFEAIWKDESLPLVMKELIGRTQISIMKVALTDTRFFENDQHPARVILNEFAMAGIAWTEKELLANDSVYQKIKELVERMLAEPELSNGFLQGLINELRKFKNSRTKIDAGLEQRIRESEDHSDRLEDVSTFVTQKIDERILNDDLDPSIHTLLHTNFHDFLVKLVLKEGFGGSSWKPVMSTIDVLLWTVKSEKQPGDKERYEKINPRLLDNLQKALEIGGTSKSKTIKIIRQLKQVQEYSFHQSETAAKKRLAPLAASSPAVTPETAAAAAPKPRKEPPPLPRDDPHLRQVDKFPIGIWLEFKGAGGQPVRCTLAAKIDSIDKMFFVNHQGVKVVELTRMRLARELKVGSVKIVSEGSLVDRAMESVISSLRKNTSPA